MARFAFRLTSGEERVEAVFWHTKNELAETTRNRSAFEVI